MNFSLKAAAVVGLALAGSAKAQDLAGNWIGTLHANQDLRLLLHVESAGASEWRATLASLDQDNKAMPVEIFWIKGNEVVFTVKTVGGSFQGKLNGAGELTGYWLQGASLPLTLTHKK